MLSNGPKMLIVIGWKRRKAFLLIQSSWIETNTFPRWQPIVPVYWAKNRLNSITKILFFIFVKLHLKENDKSILSLWSLVCCVCAATTAAVVQCHRLRGPLGGGGPPALGLLPPQRQQDEFLRHPRLWSWPHLRSPPPGPPWRPRGRTKAQLVSQLVCLFVAVDFCFVFGRFCLVQFLKRACSLFGKTKIVPQVQNKHSKQSRHQFTKLENKLNNFAHFEHYKDIPKEWNENTNQNTERCQQNVVRANVLIAH